MVAIFGAWIRNIFIFLLLKSYIAKLIGNYSFLNSYHYAWFILVIYLFGIGYFGYKQKGIFGEILADIDSNSSIIKNNQAINNQNRNKDIEKNQYLKSGLTDEEAGQIKTKLEKFMLENKPYLDYNITLPKLAYSLDTTPNKLSQVINEKYNSNFFDFINKYRISEFISLLNDPSKNDEKIMGLAYDCGFNSKSAFYNFLKKKHPIHQQNTEQNCSLKINNYLVFSYRQKLLFNTSYIVLL